MSRALRLGFGRGGLTKKRRQKRWRREKRGTVLILWRLSQTSSLPSFSLPPSLLPPLPPHNPVPRSLVLPTSSPGNKDFHSCAWGDPQQGRGGRERGGRWEIGGGIKVGQFEDHRDRARSLKLCCFCRLLQFLPTLLISELVETVPPNAHSGKVWWECFRTGLQSRLQHWDKHSSSICVELRDADICFQMCFTRRYISSLLGLISHSAYRTFIL